MNTYLEVLRADCKRVVREPFLLFMVVYLPFVALLLRWLIPTLTVWLKKTLDLQIYYPLINALMVLTLPFIFGVVLGMQMLSEKDEKSMFAIAVTPFSFRRYFLTRVLVFSVASLFLTWLTHFIIGTIGTIHWWEIMIVCVVLALNVPISALLVSSLAKNQVQGFAVVKASGFLVTAPGLSFLLPQHWDMLFGIIPCYWPIKAYFLVAESGSFWFFCFAVAMAIVTQGIAIYILYRSFVRRLLLL